MLNSCFVREKLCIKPLCTFYWNNSAIKAYLTIPIFWCVVCCNYHQFLLFLANDHCCAQRTSPRQIFPFHAAQNQFFSSSSSAYVQSTILSSDLLTGWFKGLAIHVFGFRLTSTVLEVKLSHLVLLEIILEQWI